MQGKAFGNPPALGPGVVNSRAWRAAEICSANGHTNARSLATFYAALGAWTRGETFRGVQLISKAGMERARTEQAAGVDKVLQLSNRIALGFMLPSPMRRFSDNPKAFGHGGAGGSLGFCDPENGVSFVRHESDVIRRPRRRSALVADDQAVRRDRREVHAAERTEGTTVRLTRQDRWVFNEGR